MSVMDAVAKHLVLCLADSRTMKDRAGASIDANRIDLMVAFGVLVYPFEVSQFCEAPDISLGPISLAFFIGNPAHFGISPFVNLA